MGKCWRLPCNAAQRCWVNRKISLTISALPSTDTPFEKARACNEERTAGLGAASPPN